MIKPITVYQTSDGARFDTPELAAQREKILAEIVAATAPLGIKPVEVVQGKGWIHHNLANVRETKRNLLRLAEPLLKSYEWYREDKFDEIHPMSAVGRIITDGNSPIYSGWHRLMCTDSEGREYDQPYFAMQPHSVALRGGKVCIEDRR